MSNVSEKIRQVSEIIIDASEQEEKLNKMNEVSKLQKIVGLSDDAGFILGFFIGKAAQQASKEDVKKLLDAVTDLVYMDY